jgi:hypothetical protein
MFLEEREGLDRKFENKNVKPKIFIGDLAREKFKLMPQTVKSNRRCDLNRYINEINLFFYFILLDFLHSPQKLDFFTRMEVDNKKRMLFKEKALNEQKKKKEEEVKFYDNLRSIISLRFNLNDITNLFLIIRTEK